MRQPLAEGLAQVDKTLRAVDSGLPERLMSLARFAAGNLQLALSEQGLSAHKGGSACDAWLGTHQTVWRKPRSRWAPPVLPHHPGS